MRDHALAALLTLLPSAALTIGCSATHVVCRTGYDPLDQVVEKAKGKYYLTWIDENTLEVTDPWVTHSIITIGYSAFHGELHFEKGTLYSQFYLQNNSLLGLLFFPQYLDTKSEFFGWALKPLMQKEMREILDWAGSSPVMETVRYAPPEDIKEAARAGLPRGGGSQ